MGQNEQTAGKRLAVGTIVYMFGNLTSKILQMLILPIITATLLTTEYGYYDLVVTTISLVTPVITLQLIEGMFRNMFDTTEEIKKKTVSTVTVYLFAGFLLLGIAMLTIHFVLPNIQYPFLIYTNYVSAIIFNYVQKLARCQQKNKQFAIAGVLNTIVMLGTQAITLLVFKMRVDGMLLANSISYVVASLYLGYYLHIKQWLSLRAVDKSTFTSLIKYSAPLIPNSIGWWLVASSDRYIITFFMGTAANGIYSIAGKFSQLLMFVTSVFQLAWQESAIMEVNSEKRDQFYTQTFDTYLRLLMGGYVVILPFIRLIMPILLDESYYTGYLYNPILLLGAVFSAFSQFYGSAYMVFKKTSGAFYTTIIAAIVNITVGVGLISSIGLFAPALGTTLAFCVQWLVRAHQLRDCFHVTIDKKAFIILFICMSVIIAVYYINSILIQIVGMCFGMVIFVLFNSQLIINTVKKFKK